MGRAYHKSTFIGTDIPSGMPLRGREEHESVIHPRHVARMGNEGRAELKTGSDDDSVGGVRR